MIHPDTKLIISSQGRDLSGSRGEQPAAARSSVPSGLHDDDFDLRGLIMTLRRHLLMIAGVTTASLALAVTYLAVTPPTYTSTAALYIEPKSRSLVSTQDQQEVYGPDLGLVESQAAIITSDKVLRRAVDKLDLVNDPEFAWQGGKGPLSRLRSAFGIERPAVALADQALLSLSRALRVSRAQKTYVVEISASSPSPAKAALLAEAVAQAFLDDQKDAKTGEARQANALIDARLGELKDQVRSAETRIDNFKRANRILYSDGGLVTEQQLTKLNGELITARAAAAESKARHDQILLALSTAEGVGTLPDAVKSSLIQRLREQYSQVARREAALNTQLGPRHPVLVDVRSQLSEVSAQIEIELKRVAEAAKSEYEIATSRERELSRTLERAKDEVSLASTAQIKLRELQQDADASRELLRAFLARAKETQEQANITTPGGRIISPAAIPTSPSQPLSMLILGLSLIGGLGLGLASALVSDLFDGRVRSAGDVRRVTGLKILAEIPRAGRNGFAKLGSSSNFKTVLTAMDDMNGSHGRYRQSIFRLLERIKTATREARVPSCMLIEASRGAGSATTSFALAHAAALQGERVLLVDASSTDAQISNAFAGNIDGHPAVVLDKAEHLSSITKFDTASGVYVLPIALADLRTLTMQQRSRLVIGLRALSQDFSVMFIDGGCLLDDEAVTSLFEAADSAVVIAKSGATDAVSLQAVSELLEGMTINAAGLVLHTVERS